MSASWPGSMRAPRVKTPVLLLLLLLLSTLTGTVFCQSDDDTPDPGTDDEGAAGQDAEGDDGTHTLAPPEPVPEHTTTSETPPDVDVSVENPIEDEHGSGLPHFFSVDEASTESFEYSDRTLSTSTPDEEGLSPIIILIPVVLVVLIIGMIVCGIFINRRWNNQVRNQELRKEDPYLDESSTEKVPMPMFEEDVPSVLELEMEELDQWMKKDGEAAEESHLA